MITNDLQTAILRTLVAHLAETGEESLDAELITKGLLRAGLARDAVACDAAFAHLLSLEALSNGKGPHVSLTGAGLILGLGIQLAPSVENALREVFARNGTG